MNELPPIEPGSPTWNYVWSTLAQKLGMSLERQMAGATDLDENGVVLVAASVRLTPQQLALMNVQGHTPPHPAAPKKLYPYMLKPVWVGNVVGATPDQPFAEVQFLAHYATGF